MLKFIGNGKPIWKLKYLKMDEKRFLAQITVPNEMAGSFSAHNGKPKTQKKNHKNKIRIRIHNKSKTAQCWVLFSWSNWLGTIFYNINFRCNFFQ